MRRIVGHVVHHTHHGLGNLWADAVAGQECDGVTHRGADCRGKWGGERAGVSIHVRLQEVRKRRLDFAVEVSSARGSISSGRHERAVIDLARFGGAGAAR
jgi:hypothetical protein